MMLRTPLWPHFGTMSIVRAAMPDNVTALPEPPRPPATGATRWQIARGRAREAVGRLLGRVGAPGAIANATIADPVTGQEIEIRVGHLLTRVTVNGRDYYFDRLSGRYDGTGSGCASRPSGCTSGSTPR